jgi:hypothetical protein
MCIVEEKTGQIKGRGREQPNKLKVEGKRY